MGQNQAFSTRSFEARAGLEEESKVPESQRRGIRKRQDRREDGMEQGTARAVRTEGRSR
jgi:hypothetical protein